jgi:uncharacterized membrane protein YkvA (DUF1232 family)
VAGRLKNWARSIKKDAHAIYLAARDPRTPWYAKALAITIAAYALSPIDLIPDFIPILGFVDEIILLPIAIVAVVKLIPADVMAESRAAAAIAAERPVAAPCDQPIHKRLEPTSKLVFPIQCPANHGRPLQ